tara:strand:- start:669 stop:1325 length:657 start_codon:yes stop_codon:yes gene_type:complete
MSRIIVFGDSFATKWDYDYAWTNQLADKFNAEQINYAVGGSSIEYSLFQLKDYLQNHYDQNDKIIFVATNPSRSPIIHADYNPKWACFYKVADDNEYYKTLTRYTDIEIDKYKYWIVATILNGISNDALMLCAFDRCDEKSIRKNFIISQFNLSSISNHYPEANHLHKPNHDVLAELLYQSIINKNDLLDQQRFEQPPKPKSINKKVWSDWFQPNSKI